MPGFGVRVSPAGTKTFVLVYYAFVLVYYATGRKRRMSIGRYPVISLAEARQKARDVLNRVAHRSDPQGERAAGGTFRVALEEFLDTHAVRHYRQSHAHEMGRLLRSRFVAVWGSESSQVLIVQTDVSRVIEDAMKAGTPSAANHALSAIRKFFNWCVECRLIDTNPAAGTRRPAPVGSRERFLSEGEVEYLARHARRGTAVFSYRPAANTYLAASGRGCWHAVEGGRLASRDLVDPCESNKEQSSSCRPPVTPRDVSIESCTSRAR